MNCMPQGSSVHGIFQAKNTGVDYCRPLRSSVHRIFQARTVELVAISSPGDIPDPGIDPVSLESPALAAGSLPVAQPGQPGNRDSKYDRALR